MPMESQHRTLLIISQCPPLNTNTNTTQYWKWRSERCLKYWVRSSICWCALHLLMCRPFVMCTPFVGMRSFHQCALVFRALLSVSWKCPPLTFSQLTIQHPRNLSIPFRIPLRPYLPCSRLHYTVLLVIALFMSRPYRSATSAFHLRHTNLSLAGHNSKVIMNVTIPL